MAAIGLAYVAQDSVSHNVVIRRFTEGAIPRIYDGTAAYGRTASGGTTVESRAGRQKYIWAISAPLSKADALEIDAMFKDWDEDRSNGYASAVGVTDETFGSSLTTTAVFSTPPSYEYVNEHFVIVTFGLTEV
jgi:hypothetical protein